MITMVLNLAVTIKQLEPKVPYNITWIVHQPRHEKQQPIHTYNSSSI